MAAPSGTGAASSCLTLQLYRYRPRHELQAEEQERVQRYTAEIARAWNIKFPPGSNPELQLMGHLWEPLKVVHKPLFVHIASEVSVLLTHLALLVRSSD